MKRFMKSVSLFLIAVLFSFALSGCTKTTTTNPNASKVVVWSFEDEDVWKPIKTDFERSNKGLTLEYHKENFDSGYENRVLNSILSGTGPDVWSMPNDWVYRHKDKLIPADTAMAKKINIDSTYVPSVKSSIDINDNIYALPASAEPLMIYYNIKLFDAALAEYTQANQGNTAAIAKANNLFSINNFPGTWTNFADLVKIITQKNGGTITRSAVAMGTDSVVYSQDILYLLMLQNKTRILSEDLKLANFNLPKDTPTSSSDIPGKQALDFYASFANPASVNYTWSDSIGNSVEAFATGKVAMIFGYDTLQNVFAQKYPNFTDYRKAYVPQVSAEASSFVDYARFNAFGVSSISLNPAASWNLVYQLSTTEAASLQSATKTVSANKATSYDDSLANRTGNNPEKLSLGTAQSFTKGRFPTEFDINMRNAIYAVNRGIQDSMAALNLAATNITELLKKTDW